MKRFLAVTVVPLALGACDPEEPGPGRGTLEWELGSQQAFRRGDRIEFVGVAGSTEPGLLSACGFLTETAFMEIRRTLAAIDPAVDYSLAEGECGFADSPAAQVHVRGAEHSPFYCDQFCCRDELSPVALVYFNALNNLQGVFLESETGERIAVIDVERPCEPRG